MPILKNPTNLIKGPTILPQERCKGTLLVFEDPLYSFYTKTFPLLKEYGMRALLGVAPRYIVSQTTLDPNIRLSVPYGLSMQDGFFAENVPFCTWEELTEMVRSGHVEVACHSYSKMNLTFSFVNLQREIVESKKVLEERLPQVITSFIYPFGARNKQIAKMVSQHYNYAFY